MLHKTKKRKKLEKDKNTKAKEKSKKKRQKTRQIKSKPGFFTGHDPTRESVEEVFKPHGRDRSRRFSKYHGSGRVNPTRLDP